MNTKEIKRPSTLTEKERTETTRLIEAFNQIPDDIGKLLAVTYIEGMAAANMTRPPKSTA